MSWPRPHISVINPSAPNPVSFSWQLKQLACWVDAQFTKPRGGVTYEMESEWHAWQYVLEANDKPTVLVAPSGEDPRGDSSPQAQARTPRVDRPISVFVIRGHGFTTLMETEKGVPSRKEMLTDSIEALRDVVRQMTGISEEFPIRYNGWKPLPQIARPNTGNVFVAGAILRFGVANDIPEVSRTAVPAVQQ